MQNKRTIPPEDRLLQESYTHGEPRHVTGSECAEIIRDLMVLHPELPATHMAEHLDEVAPPEALAGLDRMLRAKYVTRMVRNLRAADRRAEAAQGWLFPEIRAHIVNLPLRLPIGNKKTVERAKACYADLDNYLKVLNRRNRERHEKRIASVVALMEIWPPRSKKLQGVTLQEVDEAKARNAGLI